MRLFARRPSFVAKCGRPPRVQHATGASAPVEAPRSPDPNRDLIDSGVVRISKISSAVPRMKSDREEIERKPDAARVPVPSLAVFIIERIIRQIKAAIVVDLRGYELLLPDWRLVMDYHKHSVMEAEPSFFCCGSLDGVLDYLQLPRKRLS
jgi:hypothetical protein